MLWFTNIFSFYEEITGTPLLKLDCQFSGDPSLGEWRWNTFQRTEKYGMEKLWKFHKIGKYQTFHGNISGWDGQVTNQHVEQNAANYDLISGQATVWNLSKRNHANDQNFNNGDKVIVQSHVNDQNYSTKL